MTRFTADGVIRSAVSGHGGAWTPRGRVVDDERVDRLDLAARLELRDQVDDRLVLRVEVEQDADVAELERGVMRTTFLFISVAARRRLTAMVVRPTPPFGLNTAMTVPGATPFEPRPWPRHRHDRLAFSRSRGDLADRGGELVR
jgi:hypothetical protein